ncbi:SMTL1 protein, partial [Nesospiza acunhae]|nr:SMTL1 protein [Nesospiza acunhae]
RPRVGTRAQGRSAILEKFGGAAKGPAPHLRRSGGAATVKTMLLEWSFDFASLEPDARRDNFALAFATAECVRAAPAPRCPRAPPAGAGDRCVPSRRERAGCAPLLEVEDMVRLPVPDAKCVYTYVQELYRCLVAKGLVKTKKR